MNAAPQVTRVVHELRRRRLTVARVEKLAPGMQRVVLRGKDLAGFNTPAFDDHVLIGDETALPAIARRLEELPAGSRARVFVEVETAAAWRDFALPAGHEVVWVSRGVAPGEPAQALIRSLRDTAFAPARRYFWVAMETQAARAVRRHLYEERGVEKQWIKAVGYWQRARPGAHEHIADDE